MRDIFLHCGNGEPAREPLEAIRDLLRDCAFPRILLFSFIYPDLYEASRTFPLGSSPLILE